MGHVARRTDVGRPACTSAGRGAQDGSGWLVVLATAAALLAAPSWGHGGRARGDEPSIAERGTVVLEELQQAVASLVDRLGPSVVAIRVDRARRPDGDKDASRPGWTDAGSGIILREDGTILTSQHVVGDATAVEVVLHDGRKLRATPVAADARSDLAVVRVAASGLVPAELGDARELRRGHIVLAIGYPFGAAAQEQAAASIGLVSAVNRFLPDELGRREDRYYGDMIRTTAGVGPGSSGGPLVDIHGRVVGVVTAAAALPAGAEAFGFAMPINSETRVIIDKLVRGWRVEYGYLGVLALEPTEAQRRDAAIPERQGALLDAVFPGSPADRAGLKAGDLIATVDRTAVLSPDHFIRLIGTIGPGHRAEVAFFRDGQRQAVAVELARRPLAEQQPLPGRSIAFRGAVLGGVNQSMREACNLPEHALLVLRVDEGSPSGRAGLAPGDIVIRIQGRPVPADAERVLGESFGQVLLGLANGGSVLVERE